MGCTQVAPVGTAKEQAFCFPCEAVEPGGTMAWGVMAWGAGDGLGIGGDTGFRKFQVGSPGKEGVPCLCHTHLCSRSGSSLSLAPGSFGQSPACGSRGPGGGGDPGVLSHRRAGSQVAPAIWGCPLVRHPPGPQPPHSPGSPSSAHPPAVSSPPVTCPGPFPG